MDTSKNMPMDTKSRGSSYVLISVLLFTVLIVAPGLSSVYALELYSKNEMPKGIPYDTWVSQYWNWWLDLNTDEATPTADGCLMNESGSMIMLMETTVEGSPHQVCNISSNQSLIIPLWIAWCDTGDHKGLSDEQLTKCAREEYNLGKIGSQVKIDGSAVPLADLDVVMSLISGSLDYDINSLTNVTEYFSNGFNLTIPEDSQAANSIPGTWRAGSHGWWVFLKQLPPGEHTVQYNIRVTPTGALTSPGTNPHFADITYKFQVD
jgi:hypothetical protein